MTTVPLLLYILLFPGFLFLLGWSFVLEFVDRKVLARAQARVGPPFVQPFADFVKLLGKEVIRNDGVDPRFFDIAPAVALASVAAAFLYVPVFGPSPIAFQGDLVVALYLLTVPTVVLFLLGWLSRNVFAAVGGIRAVTLMFIYEVPLYIALLSPGILAGTWSITGVVEWQASHTWMVVWQPAGLLVALVGLQAKLERTPFDIPDAETEIVAGPLTDLTGRRLALMGLCRNVTLATGCALVAALFLGGPGPVPAGAGWAAGLAGFGWFLAKTLAVLLVLTGIRAATARLRIDQMSDCGWRLLLPAAIAQLALVLALNAWMEKT